MELSAEKEWYGYSVDTRLNTGGDETYQLHIIKKSGMWRVHFPPMHEYVYLNYLSPADARQLEKALKWTIAFCHKLEVET